MTDLLQKTELPESRCGNHRIEKFEVSKSDADFHNLRCAINRQAGRSIAAGQYTRLVRGDGPANSFGSVVVMSDTPAELDDHYEPVYEAGGNCLIAGLGLGVVAEACLRKEAVEKVTIIELEQEVIDLVGPYLKEKYGSRVEIIHDDILTWKPPKGVKYLMAWFDIWDHICEDNLPEMKLLTRKYGKRAAWKGCWARELL